MKDLNTRELINDWLMQLKPGDPAFTLDERGQCRLVSDVEQDHCIVYVPADDKPSYHLFQDVWRLPDVVRAGTYEGLLALNLLGARTGGGFLGFDGDTRSLVFSFTGNAQAAQAKSFYELLDRFFETAQSVRASLASLFDHGARKNSPAARPVQYGSRKFEIQRLNER